MIEQLALVLTFLITCSSQWKADYFQPPDRPVIDGVEVENYGLTVRWVTNSNQPILYQTIFYTDQYGREEQLIIKNGNARKAFLPFVRPCESYDVQISVANAFGSSMKSDKTTAVAASTDKPSAPKSLAVSRELGGYQLSWEAPTPGPFFGKYVIIGLEDDDNAVEQLVQYDQSNTMLTNFDISRPYDLKMVTENNCGRSTESGAVHVNAISVPPKPKITEAVPSADSITLYFETTSPPEDVDYYQLSYTTPFVDMAFGLKELPDSIPFKNFIKECFNHTFTVTAVNPAGESEPAILNAMTLSNGVPEKPSDLDLSVNGDSFALYWSVKSESDTLNHRIEYVDRKGQKYMEWAVQDARKTIMHHMKKCNSYVIRVQSENSCGWSELSDRLEKEFPPFGPPLRPSNLKQVSNDEAVLITWDKGDNSELRLQYDILVIGNSDRVLNFWASPTSTSFLIKGLTVGTQYSVHLRAQNECGWSSAAKVEILPTK